MDKKPVRPESPYPEPKKGPLGENHADYARPRQWVSKADGDLQSKLFLWGIVATVLGFILVVAYLAIFGKGRFLN